MTKISTTATNQQEHKGSLLDTQRETEKHHNFICLPLQFSTQALQISASNGARFSLEKERREGKQAEREMKPTKGVILSSACDESATIKYTHLY